MREVPKDDKWQNEREANDRRRDEYAISDALEEDTGNATGPHVTFGVEEQKPTEAELATIAVLMRLYDLNLAILNHLDPSKADEIYEAHEQGGSFNPPVFIPEITGDEDPAS